MMLILFEDDESLLLSPLTCLNLNVLLLDAGQTEASITNFYPCSLVRALMKQLLILSNSKWLMEFWEYSDNQSRFQARAQSAVVATMVSYMTYTPDSAPILEALNKKGFD